MTMLIAAQAAPENGLTGGLPPTTYEESEDCLMV